MKMLAGVFASPSKFERMQRLGRFGQRFVLKGGVITSLPGQLGGWTAVRDVFPVANQTFREWWRERAEAARAVDRPGPARAKEQAMSDCAMSRCWPRSARRLRDVPTSERADDVRSTARIALPTPPHTRSASSSSSSE